MCSHVANLDWNEETFAFFECIRLSVISGLPGSWAHIYIQCICIQCQNSEESETYEAANCRVLHGLNRYFMPVNPYTI